jgi:hypothetical protein
MMNERYYVKNSEKIKNRSRHRAKMNPEMNRSRSALWYSNNFSHSQAKRRLRNYGIEPIEYDRLYQIQGGACAICRTHQTELNKSLHVDHDHKTNIVRGLLCSSCNGGLGLFGDDTRLMADAISYLGSERIE